MSHMHDYSIAVSVQNIRIYPTRYLDGAGSRPWDRGGGVGSLPKNTFWPFKAQFGPKQGGARVPRAPPLDPPLFIIWPF